MSRIEQLETMWRADQSDPDVPYMIAQEHASAGDHQKAVEWFDHCLRIDAEYHYAYFHKARALDALGLDEEALTTAKAGLARAKVAEDAKAADELGGLVEMLGG
jgi:tetratricopeptide (TPR) repeat protein